MENRQRLLLEIYEATREILGPDYVLGARINGDDLCLGGTTLLHSTKTACELALRYYNRLPRAAKRLQPSMFTKLGFWAKIGMIWGG